MKIIQYKDRNNKIDNKIQYNRHGGLLKFQSSGNTSEIKSDDRSWLKKQWDNLATAYNTSQFANSGPAWVLANNTPFGVLHYGFSGTPLDSALSVIPQGKNIKGGASAILRFADEKLPSIVEEAKKVWI